MSFKKVCKVCGRTFHSGKYSSKFCSENCYVRAKNWAKETRYLLEKEGDKRTLNQILYHKECLYCGLPFTAKNTRAVYCSPKCGKLHRKAKSDAEKVASGTENSGFKFVANPSAPREFYIPKVCVCCGKEFMAPRPNGRFCCTKCHDAHDRKARQEYKDVVTSEERRNILKGKFLPFKKFCTHCGKEFTANKQTTMFCSSACAKKYRIRQDITDRARKVSLALENELKNFRRLSLDATK